MYKPEEGKELKPASRSFRTVAAEVAADDFLLYSTPQKREGFRRELAEALDESSEVSASVIAGLKEAGLTHITTGGRARLWIRGLSLSNPDPAEFSSKIKGALADYSSRDPIAILAERGQEVLDGPNGPAEVNEWLEGMEIAIRHR